MNAEIQRDLGRVEGRLLALERDAGEIKTGMEKQDERLARIETLLAETKGGWRVLLGAASAGAALMGVVMKLLPYLPPGR